MIDSDQPIPHDTLTFDIARLVNSSILRNGTWVDLVTSIIFKFELY